LPLPSVVGTSAWFSVKESSKQNNRKSNSLLKEREKFPAWKESVFGKFYF